MRRFLIVVLALAVTARISAQGPLVVGSGNFFSPIVAKLEPAIGFYRQLGLEVMGEPSNADSNEPLRRMFGLPAARLRWAVAREPFRRTGVEIVEATGADARPLRRRVQDPGATMLRIGVSSLERVRTQLHLRDTESRLTDLDDHFIEVFQEDVIVPGNGPRPQERVRLTVDDASAAMRLYRDALGMPEWASLGGFTQEDGLTLRSASVSLPGAESMGLLEFAEYRDAGGRRTVGRIQDPGSTRLQLRVRDLDAAIKTVVAAGGAVVSTGGAPVELPGGAGPPTRAAIVRDPNNLFLVLIQAGTR